MLTEVRSDLQRAGYHVNNCIKSAEDDKTVQLEVTTLNNKFTNNIYITDKESPVLAIIDPENRVGPIRIKIFGNADDDDDES